MHNTRQSKDKAATNNHCCVIISMDFRFYLVHFSARETSSCTEVVHVWEVFFVLGVFSRTVLLFDSIVNCRTTLKPVTEYGPKGFTVEMRNQRITKALTSLECGGFQTFPNVIQIAKSDLSCDVSQGSSP